MPRGDKSTAPSRKSTRNWGVDHDSAKLNQAKSNSGGSKDANTQKKCKTTEKEYLTENPVTPKKKKKNSNVKSSSASVMETSALDDPKAKATTTAKFCEEDNFVEFEVSGEADEFPSDAEMGSEHSEVSSDEEDSEIILSQNNNANIEQTNQVDNAITDKVTLKDSFSMMQDFLIHKGVLSNSMSEDDMNEFLKGVELGRRQNPVKGREEVSTSKELKKKNKIQQKHKEGSNEKSVAGTQSSITIYQKAVPQINAGDSLGLSLRNARKESSSFDDFVETSNESPNFSPESINPIGAHFFADVHTGDRHGQPEIRHDVQMSTSGENKEPTPEEQAEQLVLEAEKSRARMYDITGKHNMQLPTQLAFQQISLMDQDYQMIDAHLDDHLKWKIWAFEYIDLSRVLSRGRNVFEEEGQRLEIINKNGSTYLSPATDKGDVTAISSYFKWEQAFRIYSNVLTSKFPHKATELLQYNHTIQTASMTYIWENVYSYDKEFRYHISRHPLCSWSVILQQAWTMLIKDRLKPADNSMYHWGNNHHRGNGKICK